MHRNNISLTVVRERSFDNLLAGDDIVRDSLESGTMLSPRQLNSAGNGQQHQLQVGRIAVAGDAAAAAAGWRAQTPENQPQVDMLPKKHFFEWCCATSGCPRLWGALGLHACDDNLAVAWCRTIKTAGQLCSSRLSMAVAIDVALGLKLLHDTGIMIWPWLSETHQTTPALGAK